MEEDRSWMYNKYLQNGRLNIEWYNGVIRFLELAFSNPSVVTIRDDKECIPCPCLRCTNLYHLDRETVTKHLLDSQFCMNYERWRKHGEGERSPPIMDDEDTFMEGMLKTAAANIDMDWEDHQHPNLQAKRFFEMLAASEEPLWEIDFEGESKITSGEHSILSTVTRCLQLKAENQMSQRCFNGMMQILKDVLPKNEKFPSNFYQARKLVQGLGLKYKKYDVCVNFCMLYYKQNENKEVCDICKEPRYEPLKHPNEKKRVGRKVLRYLPITERLQRLYMTPSNAKHMRYHKEGKREKPKLMVHPADAEAWKHFDKIHPEFAAEVRNVRLGLTTDGFMPFNPTASPYSCWPVFVFPYNLPPGLLMKEEYMFLSLIIPGPKHPGRDIDILLQPLVDELNDLWKNGVETYDVSRKENFNMKAALLWTVSDFPAYENLSGWGTKGNLGCPYCMDLTKSFWLPNGGKTTWFDCHRRFLALDHPFRRDRKNFYKGRVESELPIPIKTGEEIYKEVQRWKDNKWGKKAPIKQNREYGVTHHWQKMSILWELPYWKTNLLRHCIDMMHLEKNFTENILFMLFDMSKTKDNSKARQDLAMFCNRGKLHMTSDNKKPRAPYDLSPEKRKQVFKWLKEEVKFPEGYAANWSRCVNVEGGTITGLKSHDFHVFMERLLPCAFRDFIPDEIWEPLCEVSSFFREICAKDVDPDRVDQLAKDIIVTICKLEKHFPPGFFDSMEHLVIHVAHEVKMGGPVGPRWMYPCERQNKYAKMMVTNKAQVEGSMAQGTLIKEISKYCSTYLADRQAIKETEGVDHNGDGLANTERLSVFDTWGHPLGKGNRRTLDGKEYANAHNYVILNCIEVQPYLEEFDNVMTSDGTVARMGSLDKAREKEFANWLEHKVDADPDCDPQIHKLARRPLKEVTCYKGYDINGFRFHTKSHAQYKSTNNSGVCVTGQTADGKERDYYGILHDVYELQYPGADNKVLLFKCHWFDIINGIREDKKHGFVEVKHTSTLRTAEPFIMACQASQVYYLSYAHPGRNQWWVAMKTRRKGNLGIEVYDADNEFFQEEQPNCPVTSASVGQDIDWDALVLQEDDYLSVDPSELATRPVLPFEIDEENEQDHPYCVDQQMEFNAQEQEESDEEPDFSDAVPPM